MTYAGLPWRADVHDRLLTELLGPRPAPGAAAGGARATAGRDPHRLRRARRSTPTRRASCCARCRRAGLPVSDTRSWTLEQLDHPGIPALLEYKKLTRLLTANGWTWLDTWVRDGRFRSCFLPGGVVTGRWASNGGGALSVPDAGPPRGGRRRGLAVRRRRRRPARAARARRHERGHGDGRGRPVDRPVPGHGRQRCGRDPGRGQGRHARRDVRRHPRRERPHDAPADPALSPGHRAGGGGRPRGGARRGRAHAARPRVAAARRARGRSGRSTSASRPTTAARREDRDRRRRAWGRFTRNFVVQGTGGRVDAVLAGRPAQPAVAARRQRDRSSERPHLVFFLHDEVVVHTPEHLADDVGGGGPRAPRRRPGRLLFGAFPVDFPLDVAVVRSWADAG